MKKILIVDDEEKARSYLGSIIKELMPESSLFYASNGIEAILKIDENSFNLVFLDIEMPKMNGLEVAQTVEGKNLKIIFTTAYHEHALKAFEVSALDYVLKPFNTSRIAKAIARSEVNKKKSAIENSSPLLEKICFKIESSYRVFPFKGISAISRLDDYLEVYYKEEKLLVSQSLDSLEEKLPKDKFIRIHRSHMINLDFLSELKVHGSKKYSVCLSDYYELELPVSRNIVQKLKKVLGLKNI